MLPMLKGNISTTTTHNCRCSMLCELDKLTHRQHPPPHWVEPDITLILSPAITLAKLLILSKSSGASFSQPSRLQTAELSVDGKNSDDPTGRERGEGHMLQMDLIFHRNWTNNQSPFCWYYIKSRYCTVMMKISVSNFISSGPLSLYFSSLWKTWS